MPEARAPDVVVRTALRTLSVALRALGPLRYPLADVSGSIAYAGRPAARRRTAANHRRRAPSISEREARRLALASYREYMRTAFDFLWVNAVPRHDLLRSGSFRGLDTVRDALAGEHGCVLALTHFGSWDMAGALAVALDVPITSVMAPVGSRRVTDLVVWARERMGFEIFTAENALRGLLRALRRGRCVALLCDVVFAGPTVEVTYCGGPVRFSAVPAWLAIRTGAPLIPVDCFRARGAYHAEVHEPLLPAEGETEQQLMQRVAIVLERAVARRPEQWYPFGGVFTDEAE